MVIHEGTRMAKDGKDWHGLQTNDEFAKSRLSFSIWANRDVAPLMQVLFVLYFYYLSYNFILSKWLSCFNEKNAISPQLLCYATVISAFHCTKMPTKCASLPVIRSHLVAMNWIHTSDLKFTNVAFFMTHGCKLTSSLYEITKTY